MSGAVRAFPRVLAPPGAHGKHPPLAKRLTLSAPESPGLSLCLANEKPLDHGRP